MGGETLSESDENAEPYRDPEVLRRHYCDRGLSLRETAERLGCSRTTVATWMDRHGIERRDETDHLRSAPAHFRTHQGYERWYTTVEGATTSVLVHRLLAVSEFGFDRIPGKHVHHENGIKWDNRPSNISLLSPSEHLRDEAADRNRERGRFAPESEREPQRKRVRTPPSDAGDWDRDQYDRPWRDPHYLQYLYRGRGLSTLAIAERLDCAPSTVRRWLDRHGVERRSLSEAQLTRVRRESVPFETRSPEARDAGYEYWHHSYRRRHPDGDQSWIPVHRLLAVSEFGFDAVADNDVHHINGIRWDNRPENITLLSREHHARLTRIRERRRRSRRESSDNQNR
jgi:transposase